MVNLFFKPKSAGPTTSEIPSANLITPIVAAVIVLAIVVGALLQLKNNAASTASPAHLFYSDSQKQEFIQTDKAGKVIYQTSIKKYGNSNFEAFSPDGNVLLSTGSGPAANFLVVKGNLAQGLNSSAVKILRTAVSLNNSHNLFFTDPNHVAGVTCDQNTNCKVTVVNIYTDQYQEVIDTGITYSQLPVSVYPVGLAADSNSIFIRTLAANKLGKDDNAIYQVDFRNSKVIKSTKLAPGSGYSIALSPDEKQAAHLTVDLDGKQVINIVDLTSGKDRSTQWFGAAVADQPLTLQWSPDGNKILFQASDSILPRSEFADTKPISLAYLDVAKNKTVNLTTILDSAHHNVSYFGWLDNETAIYNLQSSKATYDFTSASSQTFKVDLNSKKAKNQNAPSGNLVQIGFW
jgi:hypothetical protein